MKQPKGYQEKREENLVYDMLIASSNITEIDKLKAQMQKEFEMKDLCEARKISGMEITKDGKRDLVCLSQKQYLEKLLHKFGINEDTKPVIGIVSRFMHNPRKEHWNAAKWILMYLHGTFEKNYEGIDKFSIGYVDSNFAGDLDKKRSTTGYVFTMAKGLICWRSI
ncbi:hypothetical protein L3X38_009924 [Prunus dulcis]|uniref:Reverse transcriptase Ty1/copia-type domain-containing protein n=1 Tax=Prunus dulcis TaxID=3755 RepID=A0AAD4WG61_PRUDU|nr:hypothetical protein L3X38_009924 [Prunus dulcis]